ncbi:hypothetical protein AVEN_133362-1 [Araneus ventricosus]|uniref:DDE-1 domain-containing protein n=1 Tax=Araneus ventricosus TaxID=182803 RepID=A0A4Y2DK43_ARAVE|nr:hypothetical protein AVEN_133362-1 [Araneus ventricosus]
MDNAHAHPQDLQDYILEGFKLIKIQFLLPNTTPLLQPMNQQVISNFEKFYIKAFLERWFEVNEGTNVTLRELWKYHFHIVACLNRKCMGKGYQENPHFCLEKALAEECC